jgi:hypothetical protein
VPEPQMRPANALFSTAQQLFTGLAVALATVALRIGHLVGSTGAPRTAYSVAFLAVAIVAGIATVVALRLDPSAGEALTADAATS